MHFLDQHHQLHDSHDFPVSSTSHFSRSISHLRLLPERDKKNKRTRISCQITIDQSATNNRHRLRKSPLIFIGQTYNKKISNARHSHAQDGFPFCICSFRIDTTRDSSCTNNRSNQIIQTMQIEQFSWEYLCSISVPCSLTTSSFNSPPNILFLLKNV